MNKRELSRIRALVGRSGGRAKSEKKIKSSKENGKLGGRPKKGTK